MANWTKQGLVFDPTKVQGRPWLKEFAQAPATVIFADFVRVYFSCRPLADEHKRYVSYSTYADFSRQNLHELLRVGDAPILALGARGAFDEFGIYPVSVITHGDVMRAYYGGWTRCESVPFNVAIGVAESHDQGKTFTRLGPGPILSHSPDEPFILSGPKIRKFGHLYYLFYIAGRRWIVHEGKPEPVYKIRLATSSDGLAWTKHNRDIIADGLGENEAQASPDVFFDGNRHHMFFCYRQPWDFRRTKSRSYRIGYAWSTDLACWTRADAQAGIDVSESGFDDEMVAYPHVFALDGQIYMYYLGNQVGKYGFGLAKLEGTL